MRRLAVLLLLAGCARQPTVENEAGPALEQAAIAAGMVRDPAATAPTGLYARDTDRLCVVPARTGYRIGATIDYGGGQGCSAAGSASRSGDALRIDFGAGCVFEALPDGDALAFPGRLPPGCDRLCTERASLSALAVDRQSDAAAEASALRDARGRLLCGR